MPPSCPQRKDVLEVWIQSRTVQVISECLNLECVIWCLWASQSTFMVPVDSAVAQMRKGCKPLMVAQRQSTYRASLHEEILQEGRRQDPKA